MFKTILKSIFIYIDIHILYLTSLLMVIRSQIMEDMSAYTN